MRKIYALMVGDKVIEKSERRNELVKKREEMNNKDAYVCTFIGRFKIVNDQVIGDKDSDEQLQENLEVL